MSSALHKPFRLGVVEGFFGLAWPWEARTAYADFLSKHSFNTYLYAPKSDRLLRQDWHIPFAQDHLEKLKALASNYKDSAVDFGIGLSPFELYRNFNAENKTLLKVKLDQINSINPSILCILFDDMQGDIDTMANHQVDITKFITEHSQASHFIFCPTYYTDDPLLITHFGSKPEHYLEDIGSLLDPDLDIFWSGPKVFSETYPAQHLQKVAEKLQRKPLIWDNYPVNDAKRLTEFLHLEPFSNQATVMQEFTSGHIANPMNQACLSQLALYSLSQYYQGNSDADLLQEACDALCPAPLAINILEDASYFQQQGLAAMNTKDRRSYLNKYLPHAEQPMAKEIINWLNDVYTFDPSCLT